ncbi:ATP-binding protein, partial [Candidatus Parcubacteria bacterium]|nr:ATP-binding protein [Candidatus Parcubacteria bacterium]
MKKVVMVSSVKRPRPTIGPDRFKKEFGGKGFIHCLVELVKNARDWDANSILITTGHDRQRRLQIVDNGRGMDEANRDAFVSVDMTTARGSRQSGQFGTGSKQMLFSHATAVEILTAPADDSGFAYRFNVDVDHYQAVVLAGGDFDIERLERRTAWSHGFPTGTQLVYTLRDPASRAILRGDELAVELAARLPLLFSEIVRVDGKALPEKKIKGKPFRAVQEHPTLGRVVFELYQPERRRIEEGLRLTAGEAGEVPIENLFSRLGPELQARFPTIFLHREVCGTISAAYLKEYANDDR